ncbi:arylamine N-acetyltransferase [Nannocystis bainbridge]|uniref:Arylamine N-acetyltransferase n=1 Tax=Nannocystis bainbridge TaxID=2995303 RepID=A0ABT5E2W9_9BACT|nr:arylamine N-acetyltransferase [Nannocystis bainbridge]MDC0720220.1 arylamine N-acetyltransferase [Nannocystis bainbridge]
MPSAAMTTSRRDDLFRRYLGILGWVGDPGLHELVSSHLIKVPFENVSKLLRPADAPKNAVQPIDEFLRGIGEQDLGGTCYALNAHFAELLQFLDYDVELLAADAGGVPRAHAVCRVTFEDQQHLVDVGYGAPFYHPIPLDSLPLQIPHGAVSYALDRHASHREAVEVAMVHQGARIHNYVAKPPAIGSDVFAAAIERSNAPDAHFMRRLKIIRFFASRVLEIDNNRLVTTHHNITTVTPIRDIDELEAVVHEALQLPRMPVREAVEALAARGIDVFATA